MTDLSEQIESTDLDFPKNIPAYWINIAVDRQTDMPVPDLAKKYHKSDDYIRQIARNPLFLRIERAMAENIAINWVIDAREHLKSMLPQVLANYEQEIANNDTDIDERKLRLAASKHVLDKALEAQPVSSEHGNLLVQINNIEMSNQELLEKILKIGNG
jgi:hypothetical protein